MPESQCEDILRKCDLDCDQQLDFHEFLTAAYNHKTLLSNSNLQKAFKLLDLNNDGFIDADDFNFVLPRHSKKGTNINSSKTKVVAVDLNSSPEVVKDQ